MKKIIPVILCGGSGSRLWPLSRSDTPKQFLKLMDNYTLLQKTALRTLSITQSSGTELVVVTLNSMKKETVRQLQEVLPLLSNHILSEPQARNTAAAVAYASLYVQRTFGDDALIWVLPADHYVGNEFALEQALALAAKAADNGHLVTFGIRPTRPETGYGYILKDESLNDSGIFKVKKFIEKPEYDLALQFMQSGEYLWSSGMHVFKASTVLESFQSHAPETLELIQKSLQDPFTMLNPSALIYGTVREEPFESAVLEKTEKIAVIPCDPQWSDIGCWESLWEIKSKNESGNATLGKVVCEETENSMILAHDRLVTCVGVKDIVVIETADSVLVAHKKSNGSLKNLVKTLQKNGHKETILSPSSVFQWGHSKTLAETPRYKIKELIVKPGQMRDLESHTDLSGCWIVTSGEALFMIDGNYKRLKEKESIFIPVQSTYMLTNPGEHDLRIFHFECNESEGSTFPVRPVVLENIPADKKHFAA